MYLFVGKVQDKNWEEFPAKGFIVIAANLARAQELVDIKYVDKERYEVLQFPIENEIEIKGDPHPRSRTLTWEVAETREEVIEL
jgi:hypothetical protein